MLSHPKHQETHEQQHSFMHITGGTQLIQGS